MNDVTLAFALHVLAVVLWIGGVGMVTTVLLPAVRRLKSAEERVAFFEVVERRFAWQARATSLLAGVTGFYLVDRLDLWKNFLSLDSWWLDAMALVWLIFTSLLFLVEPLFLDRWLEKHAKRAPEETFALIEKLHWVLLSLSLVAIAGAVAGSHGLSFFG